MKEVPVILQIARVDLSYFFRTKWLIVFLLSLNLSDIFVVALVYRGIMSMDYFQFFVPAVVVIGLFTAALDTGRRIYLSLREGIVQYYLSLPVSTGGLVAAHLLSGGATGLVYSCSLLLVAFVVLGVNNIVNSLILIPFLLLLAVGLAGLAAALAVLASTRGEFFFAYQQMAQTLLLIFSTIFYPASLLQRYLPSFLVLIASVNPLSLAADGLRSYAFGGQPIGGSFLIELAFTSLPFALLGGFSYFRVLGRIRVRGKV